MKSMLQTSWQSYLENIYMRGATPIFQMDKQVLPLLSFLKLVKYKGNYFLNVELKFPCCLLHVSSEINYTCLFAAPPGM